MSYSGFISTTLHTDTYVDAYLASQAAGINGTGSGWIVERHDCGTFANMWLDYAQLTEAIYRTTPVGDRNADDYWTFWEYMDENGLH